MNKLFQEIKALDTRKPIKYRITGTSEDVEIRPASALGSMAFTLGKQNTDPRGSMEYIASAVFMLDGKPAFTADEIGALPASVCAELLLKVTDVSKENKTVTEEEAQEEFAAKKN